MKICVKVIYYEVLPGEITRGRGVEGKRKEASQTWVLYLGCNIVEQYLPTESYSGSVLQGDSGNELAYTAELSQ